MLQGNLWCGQGGSQRLLLWVRGVRDRARVGDRVVPPPPLARRSPPSSLRGGAAQAPERGSAERGARAAQGADCQGRPLQRRGAAARLPPRGGGALESLLHSASAVIGRGGGHPPQPHLHLGARIGERTAQARSGQDRSSEDPTWNAGLGPSVAPRYAGGAGG